MRGRSLSDPNRVHPVPPQPENTSGDVVEASAFSLYAGYLKSEIIFLLGIKVVLLFAIRALCAYMILRMERGLGFVSLNFADHFTQC